MDVFYRDHSHVGDQLCRLFFSSLDHWIHLPTTYCQYHILKPFDEPYPSWDKSEDLDTGMASPAGTTTNI
jgi:hypothetical protein